MPRPNLLLCFDAFGTLFKPKRAVALQYADVARQCGLGSFSDEQLRSSFSTAFKQEAKANPNYGRATGLGATQWWTNVINRTFDPFLPQGQPMPLDLAPRLLHRFSSNEGYTVEDGLASSLRTLRTLRNSKHFANIITGVITNSDDRVPDVLSSFGLQVSPLRYGMENANVSDEEFDIDFHCMSYDVGHEKPDKRMFAAAESMLATILGSRGERADADTTIEGHGSEWLKVYVGDEYAKDVEGSVNAGWKSILLDPANTETKIPSVEDCANDSLGEAITRSSVLRVKSIRNLTSWLTTQD